MTITAIAAPAAALVRSLPAAAHIRYLRHGGLTDQQIAARARLVRPQQQLRRAARGEHIGWEVERRILAVPIPNEAALYETTSSIGARRRIRALRALGWPMPDLAAALDWPLHKLGTALAGGPIPVADHLAICALYDQRWTWKPEDHGIPADEAEQARYSAKLGRCHSPLVWDDDTLDNPKAAPRGRVTAATKEEYGAADPAAALRALDGDPVRLSGHTRTLALTYGARHLGMPIEFMAERLGMDLVTAKRTWERIKSRARAKGETWVDAPQFTDEARLLAEHRRAS